MHFPALATARLLLRQFRPEDVQQVYKGLSHPEVIRYYGVNFKTLEETTTQLDWFRELEEQGTGIWWALWLADGITFIGGAGFNNLSRAHRKAEIGFWLLPDYWGQGYITEALAAIVSFGFDKLQLHRIEAFVETENIGSSRTLLKQQFTLEGTLRDCEIKNGNFISLQVFAKLARS